MEKPRLDEVKGLLMVLWGAGDGAWVKASSSRGCSGHTTPTPGKAPSPSRPNLRGQERPQPESQEQVSVGTTGPLGISKGGNARTVPADADRAELATCPAARPQRSPGKAAL